MKYKKGSPYLIRFYDHTIGTDDIVICEIVGFFESEDKNKILLLSWKVDTDDKDLKENNKETICIIKSTIIKKKLLR